MLIYMMEMLLFHSFDSYRKIWYEKSMQLIRINYDTIASTVASAFTSQYGKNHSGDGEKPILRPIDNPKKSKNFWTAS